MCGVGLFLSRAQSSSGERKCEQGNPLLAGLQPHMDSRPPGVIDARYQGDKAQHDGGESGVCCGAVGVCSAGRVKSKTGVHGVKQPADIVSVVCLSRLGLRRIDPLFVVWHCALG